MDRWKYFDITHREHVICNPISVEKLEEFISLLRLKSGSRVLEIAPGKGEFLIRLAERYGIEGLGVDLSPYCIADAKDNHQARIPTARLRFLRMDGADYEPEEPESFDLVACIGASWIYGGYRETLEALMSMAAPGSWIVVGEQYWCQEPAVAYLEKIGAERSTYGTHAENVGAGEDLGLEVVYTVASSVNDWDRYEGLQWFATAEWASEHSDDPDREVVLERIRENRETYLRWGRETLAWALYVFKISGQNK